MDIVELLRKKIATLDDGDYILELRAVQLHIETAFRHLSRGQETSDDTAFTDAIYRTNQAFEGSIKEAYRVLAGQDPARKRPFDIENYLETEGVFRPRVLSQFTNYRTEWRNPSAHDYKLDFDESESFLAIVSVTAFACVLIDQISERLAFEKAKAEAEAQKLAVEQRMASLPPDLLTRTTEAIKEFCSHHVPVQGTPVQTEVQWIGSIHGFLSSALPNATLQANAPMALGSRHLEADLLVSLGQEHVVIELKQRFRESNHKNALYQVESYMMASGIPNGILLYLPGVPSELEETEVVSSNGSGRIKFLRAKI
ncbi:hypothetical protein [Acidovorax sp. NB1]|uniref:hypothetical protein n=1 Tax=Acidovorax sp. NB1 TaxID=1943571 RepID=UPI0010E7B238|nr:hypothetical protein [Acidovorax sp. NB1]GDY36273.1 hypothetical protein ACINB_21650 [Acidovorax sp. NB1]